MDKSKFSLLSNIKYPEDLRKLSIDQLPQVCKELREDIIDEVAVNPGHFASSLGVVEITVALHYIYNTPYDRIVWAVGGMEKYLLNLDTNETYNRLRFKASQWLDVYKRQVKDRNLSKEWLSEKTIEVL